MIEARCADEVFKPIAAFARSMTAVNQGKKPRRGLTGAQAKLLDSVDFVTKSTFGTVEIAPTKEHAVTMDRASIDYARKLTGQLAPSLVLHRAEQLGQLRGYLEQVTAKRGQPARFAIRDRITGDRVDCIIPESDEVLFKTATAALRKRVVVTGMIHFGERSRPTSIRATLVEPIAEYIIPFDQLPKAELTHDGDAAGYIRRLRDA
jgi:hypothetical protein